MERKHKHRAVRWLVQGSRWVSGGNTHSTATWPPLESTEYQEEKEGVASFYHGGFSIVLASLLRLKPLATNQSICWLCTGWGRPGGRKVQCPSNQSTWKWRCMGHKDQAAGRGRRRQSLPGPQQATDRHPPPATHLLVSHRRTSESSSLC